MKTPERMKLPRSLDELFEMTLRTVHELADAEGITPQHYVRVLLRRPHPYVPAGLRDDPGLTPDSAEYKALRAWLVELEYELSRKDLALAYRIRQKQSLGVKRSLEARGSAKTKRDVLEHFHRLVKERGSDRGLAGVIAPKLRLSLSQVRRIIADYKKSTQT